MLTPAHDNYMDPEKLHKKRVWYSVEQRWWVSSYINIYDSDKQCNIYVYFLNLWYKKLVEWGISCQWTLEEVGRTCDLIVFSYYC